MLYVKFSPNNASYVKCKSFTRKGPRVKLRVKFLPKKAPMFKGTDHAGTFMSLKCVVYYANHRSWDQSSKIQVVHSNWRSKFQNLNPSFLVP